MAQFDAVDAGLEGFRLTRERPRAVLLWAALTFVFSLVSTALLIAIAGGAFADMMALSQQSGEPDPSEALAALGGILPALALVLPIALLYQAVLYSAVFRAILRPEEGGPGFLRLGGDELRVLAAIVLTGLLLFGAVIGGAILLGLLGALAESAGGAAAGLVAFFGVLALLAGIVFVLVRLSLAPAATFAERRIRVFESWGMTKGRFWPLLGAYVLAIVLGVVIGILALMIYFAIAALLAGGVREAGSVFQPNYESLGAWLTAPMLLYLLVNALLNALNTAILLGPSAIAYRDLGGRAEPAAAA